MAGTASRAYTEGYIKFFRDITFTKQELPGMLEGMNTVFTQGMMITNLGITDGIFEGLMFKPRSLWGRW